ncbi:protein of unknown function [Methylocella tundrae]|uniref:Uncharacterized protein n=1 Tax=Methylocella tundrae TaxID=227605 RepID=A0A4U8Z4H1_METTU|nr:protein of unknown function [Methylocella tundrae]
MGVRRGVEIIRLRDWGLRRSFAFWLPNRGRIKFLLQGGGLPIEEHARHCLHLSLPLNLALADGPPAPDIGRFAPAG